ncbi:AMMECR1 domain-containing protein [Chaetomidium leptoderma]|uniref:AMMECR1 domain-containing protein n=1 Tax=Chaetomidium leptoderma TaxID=669021 RepID=A0AAN6VTV1_9PEZI|nr:AMMECR1 domain-containing protein [Chaetomidium leptoderma]
MATVEHCLYCFEALTAHLEDRKPMNLPEVLKSWAEYVRSTETDADDAAGDATTTANSSSNLSKRLPALRRVTEASQSSSSSSTASSASNSTLSLRPDTPATSVSSASAAPEPLTESPLFVTWNTLSPRGHASLRGCIGTFEAQDLDEGLSSYALISALQDTRFPPVAARELPALEVAVTLLTDFEDAADALDWQLGTHGLRISFYYHGKRYGATYLPDVAVEQGWTKEETLVSLMRKAGWVGRKEKWAEVELGVVRYQGKKERVEFAEFKRWRDWVEGGGK